MMIWKRMPQLLQEMHWFLTCCLLSVLFYEIVSIYLVGLMQVVKSYRFRFDFLLRFSMFSHSIRSFCAAWLLSQRPVIMWDTAGKSMTGSRLGMAGYGWPVQPFPVPAIRCHRRAKGIGPLTLPWTEITWGLTHNSRKQFSKTVSFSSGM